MLNAFGRWLRKFRIDNGLLLRDMAQTLEVSSAFLSALETGRKNIPDGIVEKLSDGYHLNAEDRSSLLASVAQSKRNLKLGLEDATMEARNLAFAFAKRFHSLNAEDREQILKILSKGGD